MSVAFRRESDEEHLEPRFELPLPPGPNIVTPRGLAQIETKVVEWTNAVEDAIEETIRKQAKRDLDYWNTRLATARVAEPPSEDVIGIGSHVTFRLGGTQRSIHIVGHDEAEPAAGRIAFSAPLARAMIGAGPGDVLDFGGVNDAIEVIAIGPARI